MIEKIKFGIAAIISMLGGSHMVYSIYQPMSVSKYLILFIQK